jgi:NAD(P)-dependent dehydrogenase (short-subunit alcohol dehydrogenase family)
MDRTYVVTGAASGIGAATARYLRQRENRVIGCDLRYADLIAELTTVQGRAELVNGGTRLSGGKIDPIDAIAAVAGGGPPQTSLQLNSFGIVVTLEGLRPLLLQLSPDHRWKVEPSSEYPPLTSAA